MVECVIDYLNDPIASDQSDPETYSTTLYMHGKLVDEGHDARLLRFSPSSDGSIPGKNHVKRLNG